MSDETKALIRDIITSVIKNDDEAVTQHFHGVLASKMQERTNPPEVEEDPVVDDENKNEE